MHTMMSQGVLVDAISPTVLVALVEAAQHWFWHDDGSCHHNSSNTWPKIKINPNHHNTTINRYIQWCPRVCWWIFVWDSLRISMAATTWATGCCDWWHHTAAFLPANNKQYKPIISHNKILLSPFTSGHDNTGVLIWCHQKEVEMNN